MAILCLSRCAPSAPTYRCLRPQRPISGQTPHYLRLWKSTCGVPLMGVRISALQSKRVQVQRGWNVDRGKAPEVGYVRSAHCGRRRFLWLFGNHCIEWMSATDLVGRRHLRSLLDQRLGAGGMGYSMCLDTEQDGRKQRVEN